VDYLLSKKVPKEKIIVGAQFFANTFKLQNPKQVKFGIFAFRFCGLLNVIQGLFLKHFD
jgi:hypothetical protein